MNASAASHQCCLETVAAEVAESRWQPSFLDEGVSQGPHSPVPPRAEPSAPKGNPSEQPMSFLEKHPASPPEGITEVEDPWRELVVEPGSLPHDVQEMLGRRLDALARKMDLLHKDLLRSSGSSFYVCEQCGSQQASNANGDQGHNGTLTLDRNDLKANGKGVVSDAAKEVALVSTLPVNGGDSTNMGRMGSRPVVRPTWLQLGTDSEAQQPVGREDLQSAHGSGGRNPSKATTLGDGTKPSPKSVLRRGSISSLLGTTPSEASCSQAQKEHRWILGKLQQLSALLVVLNFIYIGVQVEVEVNLARQGSDTSPAYLWWIDLVFVLLFSLELLTRIYLEGSYFWKGHEFRWNFFDVVTVGSAIFDVTTPFLNLGFLRSLRIMRAVRAVRIIRAARLVRELRLMVASIISSLRSLLWAFVLVIFVVYLFSISIMQLVSIYVVGGEADPSVVDRLLEYYGSVGASMLTLFMAISAGEDWSLLVAPLQKIHQWYALFFVVYVAFVVFGVMNILTAIFVESATHIAEVDRELVIQDSITKDKLNIQLIRRMFKNCDLDSAGEVSVREVEKRLQEPDHVEFLKVLGIDLSDSSQLLELLGAQDKDRIPLEELIYAVMRLRGAAKGVDLALVLYDNTRIFETLSALTNFVEDRFQKLSTKLQLEEELEAPPSPGMLLSNRSSTVIDRRVTFRQPRSGAFSRKV
mmetsp:Transcript_819/g.1798  ORF Transcript_819/g.1798 Transcript_819/m.1798 type:complete len:696 (+) Transcript_819:95-2182(+)|eukprot:CAMPEP_0178377976 /NCGR_PEP_ID=MMETSP0689_2-20121128/4191_1 /TAXON_ID=160604 /ORGANISM="Amphidinium massartii, Strain CS-259" /LENGTH=695 /DNA_ID=CAMNT_0019998037 /DNA_START=25 /DNA_END=2112 /DNA_ORIENTATION=+